MTSNRKMDSNYKSTQAQLIAIYKLEFYKNKKNWKLYENVKKEPPKSPNKLNRTYNVGEELLEPDYEAEQVSLHNKAFLLKEPEDGPDPQPPDAEPPDTESPSSPAPNNLYRPHSWPEQPWSGDKTEVLWQEDQQEWCGLEAEGMPEELAYDQCDGPYLQHNLWTPASPIKLNPPTDLPILQPEELTPAQMLQTAEEWLQRHGYPLYQEEYAPTYEEYGSMDESADFVRGAHSAPHSSEIDLSITQECPCTCDASLCVLTVRQLARAVQRHHAALARLLREHALRETLSCRRLPPPPPPQEPPTRDTDPLPPDCVTSGSLGRGRGRLPRTRLIGIGMGRPYRL